MGKANYWRRRGRGGLNRRRLLAGSGVAGAGFLLAACGGSSTSNTNSGSNAAATGAKPTTAAATTGSTSAATARAAAGSPAPAGTSAAAVAASTEGPPVSGGTMIAIQTRDISSLDPLSSQVYTTPERIGLVYPRLLYYDRAESDDFSATKQVPSYITDSWEFAGDGATLTFHLKKGVNYSKTPPVNGRELAANDVKFSINRYMTDPSSTFAGRYADVDSIQTPDNYTVVFKLKGPSAYILYALAAEPSLITPPEVAQASGDYKQTAIGAGPFLHVSTTQGEGSTFKKNPDFVDAAHIYYDQYQFKVITDLTTREAALRTAQADYVTTGGAALQKSDWQSVTSGNKSVSSYQTQVLSNLGIWFNVNNPKWKDLRARQAVSKGFDRLGFEKQFFQGEGTFVGPVPPGFGKWAFNDQQMQQVDGYKYDAQAAKQLWTAAGSPATTVEFYIQPKQVSATAADQAQYIGQQLKTTLGIDATYTTDEYSTFANKGYNNKFPDTCIFGMILYDPLDYLLTQYIPGGTRNGSGINDPTLIMMLNDAKATLDEAARVKKVLDAQTYINTQALTMAYLPVALTYDVYNAKLRHFLPGVRPPGDEWTFSSWKVK